MRLEELSPYAFLIHDALSLEECGAWIEWAEQRGFDEAPVTTAQGPVMMSEVRNNTRVMVDAPELTELVWARIAPMIPQAWRVRDFDGYARADGEHEAVGLNERVRVYRYTPGQRFRPHHDGFFRRNEREFSALTMLLYLNDDFEGGETSIFDPRVAQRVGAKAGMVLCFFHPMVHEGCEVTHGRKYVLRSDVMYRRAETELAL